MHPAPTVNACCLRDDDAQLAGTPGRVAVAAAVAAQCSLGALWLHANTHRHVELHQLCCSGCHCTVAGSRGRCVQCIGRCTLIKVPMVVQPRWLWGGLVKKGIASCSPQPPCPPAAVLQAAPAARGLPPPARGCRPMTDSRSSSCARPCLPCCCRRSGAATPPAPPSRRPTAPARPWARD